MNVAEFQISDAELDKVLTEIDEYLRKLSPNPAGREIHGWMLFCQRFNLINVPMNHPAFDPVFEWFRKQYGERLNLNLDFGSTVVQIRHDLYLLPIHRLYGTIIQHCDPMFFRRDLGPKLGKNGPVKTNLLESLSGVTPDFVKTLVAQDCERMLQVYERAFLGLSRVEDACAAPLVKEAKDDLYTSAQQLAGQNPNYGFSRFSSLLAVEKLLKSFLKSKGDSKWGHSLNELATKAHSLGLPPIRASLLSDVQCSASVRYESSSVNKDEALKAHYAALSLSSDIAPHLTCQSGWFSEVHSTPYLVNGTPRPMRALVVTRGKR